MLTSEQHAEQAGPTYRLSYGNNIETHTGWQTLELLVTQSSASLSDLRAVVDMSVSDKLVVESDDGARVLVERVA